MFTRTKHGANRLAQQLEKDGLSASAIHGNKSQGARTRALAGFKNGDVRILVATDIAARGLDIDQLPHVVNYELPNVSEDYVHRIGRTGRAGNEGEAISLVCVDEEKLLRDIERLLKRSIPKVVFDDYKPDPSIKAEPIQNGRGGRNSNRGDHQRPKRAKVGGGRGRSPQSTGRKEADGNHRTNEGGAAGRPGGGVKRPTGNRTTKPRSNPQRKSASSGSRRERPSLLGGNS